MSGGGETFQSLQSKEDARDDLMRTRFWRPDGDIARIIFDGMKSGNEDDRRHLWNHVSRNRRFYMGEGESLRFNELLASELRPAALCAENQEQGCFAERCLADEPIDESCNFDHGDRDVHFFETVDKVSPMLYCLSASAVATNAESTIRIQRHYATHARKAAHRFKACCALKDMRSVVSMAELVSFATEVLESSEWITRTQSQEGGFEFAKVGFELDSKDITPASGYFSAPLFCAVWLAGNGTQDKVIGPIATRLLDSLSCMLRKAADGSDLEDVPKAMLRVFKDIVPGQLTRELLSIADAAVQRDEDPQQIGWKDSDITKYFLFLTAMGSVLDNVQKLPDDEKGPLTSRLALTVEGFLRRTSARNGGVWDRVRCRALEVLSWIGEPSSAKACFTALNDANPQVVHFASQALQYVSTLPEVVSNIVSICAESGSLVSAQRLSVPLRALQDRDAVVEQLEEIMLKQTEDANRIKAARELLTEVGGISAIKRWQAMTARQGLSENHRQAMADASRDVYVMFEKTMQDAKHGFRIALAMDVVLFGIGAGLVMWSASVALVSEGSLNSWVGIGVAGGLGVLGVLYSLLISKPRKQVKNAVDHMMITKVIFLGYLRELHQCDQTFSRWLLDDNVITDEKLRSLSNQVQSAMSNTVMKMQDMLMMTQMENQQRPAASGIAVAGTTNHRNAWLLGRHTASVFPEGP